MLTKQPRFGGYYHWAICPPTPIFNPLTLVHHLPICSHLFATSYLVLTTVQVLLQVFTSCRTCSLIITEVCPYGPPANTCTLSSHLFTLVCNILPNHNNSTSAITGVYKLQNVPIDHCRGLSLWWTCYHLYTIFPFVRTCSQHPTQLIQ